MKAPEGNASSTRTAGEPLMIRFVSEITGDIYDECTVDQVADMALIFYTGAGTTLGALLGACVGGIIVAHNASALNVVVTVCLLGLLGAILGALSIMFLLNIRGLIRWDGRELRRVYRAKKLRGWLDLHRSSVVGATVSCLLSPF